MIRKLEEPHKSTKTAKDRSRRTGALVFDGVRWRDRLMSPLRCVLVLVLTLQAAAADLSLVEAVKKGDARAARALLAQKADVNAAEADGTTALHWAVEQQRSRADRRADPGRRAGRRGESARGDADSSRGDQRQRRDDRAPHRGRRRCERGAPGRRDRADDRGADRQRGRGAGARGARRRRERAGRLARADRADVGGGRKQRRPPSGSWSAAGADIRAKSTSGTFTPLLFAVRGGHVDASRALLDAGADVNERLADGMSALVLAALQRPLRAGGVSARSRRRPQCRRAGMDRAASGGVVAAAEPRLQSSRRRADRHPRQPRAGETAARPRRRHQRPADEGAARRQPQHAEPDWRDAVRDGGENGRRPADAAAARTRRQSQSRHQRRHHGADGGGGRRRLRTRREPGHARGSARSGQAGLRSRQRRQRGQQGWRDRAARCGLPRRRRAGHPVSRRQGRGARRGEQEEMDAAARGGRGRLREQRHPALSGSGGVDSQADARSGADRCRSSITSAPPRRR